MLDFDFISPKQDFIVPPEIICTIIANNGDTRIFASSTVSYKYYERFKNDPCWAFSLNHTLNIDKDAILYVNLMGITDLLFMLNEWDRYYDPLEPHLIVVTKVLQRKITPFLKKPMI